MHVAAFVHALPNKLFWWYQTLLRISFGLPVIFLLLLVLLPIRLVFLVLRGQAVPQIRYLPLIGQYFVPSLVFASAVTEADIGDSRYPARLIFVLSQQYHRCERPLAEHGQMQGLLRFLGGLFSRALEFVCVARFSD